MAMTRMQTRSVIFLVVAVITLVGVQGGRVIPNDFTFTNQPRIPINRESLGKPFTEGTTSFESEPINLGESKFWASTQNTQDVGRFTQPRGGVANEYNYRKEDTNKPSDEFFTPEMMARIKAYNDAEQAKFDRNMQNHGSPEELARVKAFNEAQRANFDSKMQNYGAIPHATPITSRSNEYPKMLSDGTEILWVTGPQKTLPEEIARLDALMGQSKSTAAIPGSRRNVEVQGNTDDPAFNVDTSNWEDGPFGTKQRPGAEHSLEYVGFEQPDRTKVPQSINNP